MAIKNPSLSLAGANEPDPTPPTLRYLCTRRAAAYLGVSSRWLEELRCIGGGPIFSRLAKKKIVYDITDLDAWVEQNRRRNTSELLEQEGA